MNFVIVSDVRINTPMELDSILRANGYLGDDSGQAPFALYPENTLLRSHFLAFATYTVKKGQALKEDSYVVTDNEAMINAFRVYHKHNKVGLTVLAIENKIVTSFELDDDARFIQAYPMLLRIGSDYLRQLL